MATQLCRILTFLAMVASLRRRFYATADSFASIAQLERIVDLEMALTEKLEKFVELEKNRLDKIKQFAESVREATDLVKTDGMKVLENPTTTYAIIKRFANGWSELGDFLSKNYSHGKNVFNYWERYNKVFISKV